MSRVRLILKDRQWNRMEPHLPGMGGVTGIKDLRATEMPFKAIAMSESFGKLTDSDVERVREKLQVDRALAKPLDLEGLPFVLEEILSTPENQTDDGAAGSEAQAVKFSA